MRLLAVATLLVAALTSLETDASGIICSSDTDCASGETCVAGDSPHPIQACVVFISACLLIAVTNTLEEHHAVVDAVMKMVCYAVNKDFVASYRQIQMDDQALDAHAMMDLVATSASPARLQVPTRQHHQALIREGLQLHLILMISIQTTQR
ncbi:uncharacterized protein PHALS_06338 [Plasmopara halstedii]|uniref:RxLR-like protein n=1 Tax=Plasmopara halstedii TaxID=4781 RepID=A0A0P1B358_PLAHL|nr:uncharacterized protein PHALS_06338 [Plasmopara halstedii]CEG48519.1 hypothetical protein PHALS_06338 [Plasmopara halstedii]|eukprot:XP_024584888.1 hypothetical protein PHALS_06338 [Plasmopara halstedii]